MPPRRPAILATFLGKITRHLSIDRWRSRSAYKRGGGEMQLLLTMSCGKHLRQHRRQNLSARNRWDWMNLWNRAERTFPEARDSV